MHNPESVLENETHKHLWDFETQMDCLILVRQPDLVTINRKKNTCQIVNFAVLTDQGIKLRESEKKDGYLNLAREFLKNVEHESDSDIIVIGAFGIVIKGLVKGLEDLERSGPVETIQTTALLRLARIQESVLGTWGGLLSLKLLWKTNVKNFQGVK